MNTDNLYLLINGQPVGPYSRAVVLAKLNAGEITPDTPCAYEGAASWLAAAQLREGAPTPPSGARLAPDELLAQVRQRSCYDALRICLNIVFGLMLAVILISTYGQFSRLSDLGRTDLALLALVAGVASCFVAFVGRQFLLMVVDIPDLLIELARRADKPTR